jgi:hypothetical protein
MMNLLSGAPLPFNPAQAILILATRPLVEQFCVVDVRRFVALENHLRGPPLSPVEALWQIQSDAPITDMDANFLESWLWAKHPSLVAALENAIFEMFDDTTMA